MIIPPLSKPNRTPVNDTIFPEAADAVTRLMVSIVAVLETGTSVLYFLRCDRPSLATRCWSTLFF